MSETINTSEPGRSRSNAARVANLVKRANSYAEQGMYEEAIANIKEAITICPTDARFSVQLANIYKAQNDKKQY